MSVGFPGGSGTMVPLLEASGNLMIEYGRNLDKFPSNNYCRITPVSNTFGTFLQFDPQHLARSTNKPYDGRWAPGTARPISTDHTLGFEPKVFQTQRYNYGIPLDKLGVDLANWPILKLHTEALAQWAITERAYQVATMLFDSTQYNASHVFSATTANGSGFLQDGTTADPRLKKTLDYCARKIQQDTLGRVRGRNLCVLFNHNTAYRLSETREIREYVMQHVDAYKMITGERDQNYNAMYGLPAFLYGMKVIVEDTFYNGHNIGGTVSPTVVVPDNKLIVLLAEGEQEQVEGGRSFNTCHVFSYEEFTVETFDDPKNRNIELNVAMNYDVQIVAPASATIVTNLFS